MEWLTRLPWMAAPAPLERRQRLAVALASLLAAISRLFAIARSPWDWDEFLFMHGVRDYNVVAHQPHPPGYPVFIAAAKAVRVTGVSDFHALQAVVVLSAMLVLPLVFLLARELRFSFATSIAAAALTVFLPNVWFYGGTAFSDVPALATGLASVILLLRGCRSFPAYAGGAALLGLSAGIRPQNLLIACVPAILAMLLQFRGSFWRGAAGLVAGGLMLVACYGGAALASESVPGYVESVKEQQQYVRNVDSFHNAGRPPLPQLARRFFVNPFGLRPYAIAAAVLGVVALAASLIRRRVPVLMALMLFGPFAAFAWLNLSFEAVTRYSVGYMPLHALLICEGIAVVSGLLWRQRGEVFLFAATAAGIVLLGAWVWPALRVVATHDSPPYAALDWVRRNTSGVPLFVDAGLQPGGDYLLTGRRVLYYENSPAFTEETENAFVVQNALTNARQAIRFVYPRGSLWQVARQRCFESTVERVNGEIRFGEGWYGQEGEGHPTHRWMSRSGTMILPELKSPGRLEIDAYVPADTVKHPITVTVQLGDQLVDRFVAVLPDIKRGWTLPASDKPLEVRFTVSEVVVPANYGNPGDTRELGMRLYSSTWRPAR